jgi:hypothetical protein
MSGQTVNQTVTVKVNGSSCSPEPPSPGGNYATQAELSAGLSSLSTAISGVVVNSSVTPANLSTLSTSIGQLSNSTSAGLSTLSSSVGQLINSTSAGLSSLSTSIGGITGSTVTPANISSLSTPIGVLENEVANIINYDLPILEAGISSLSTAIGILPVAQASANISTIQPAYSTLSMNLNTVLFPTSTNVYGNVNYVNGVQFGGNNASALSYNNGIQLSQNNIPYFLFSTAAVQVSSIYTSSFLIPITQSLKSIDFIVAGANGASYSNNSSVTTNGGLGAWIQGTLTIPTSLYGKTLEVTLPSSMGARYPTRIRLLESNIDLLYAGNGGSAAFIDGANSNFQSNFGSGGSAGTLSQSATNGGSASQIHQDSDFNNSSMIYYYASVSSGTGAVGTNGIGGTYLDSITLSNGIPVNSVFQYGSFDSNGQNGANHIGGRGGNFLFPTAYAGDGGGGYYAGGGGACIVSFENDDPYFEEPYFQTQLSAGGGGGSSYINPTYVTVTDSGLFNTVSPLLSQYTSTASALLNFRTNVFVFNGSLQINGPDGVNRLIHSI